MKKTGKNILADSVSIQKKDLLFAVLCLLLIILKHMLAVQLPLSPRPSYRTDDNLMVMMARAILKGEWLGSYGHATLMKGCFYPIFLAVCYLAGIPSLSAIDLLNSAAAIYFTLQLKNVLHKRRWMLILFAILLFNPVNAAELTFQRVYRCSISNWQGLFLFGSVIGAYLDREDRFWRQFARAFFCGFMLWNAWNTREDAMWVLPFVITAYLVILVMRLIKRRDLRGILSAVFLFALPFAVFAGGNAVVAGLNERYFGLPIRNEASANFGKMLKTMYSIKNEKEQDFVSISMEKLDRMYEASPTLRTIKDELTISLQQADASSDRMIDDGEVEDGWFFWCIRRAALNTGVGKTLPDADEFYRKVNEELQAAINAPDSIFETQWTMPSPLMSPWRAGYFDRLVEYSLTAYQYTIEFSEVSAVPRLMGGSDERISYLFEGITGDTSLHKEEEFVRTYRQMYIDRADAVTSVYQLLNPYIAGISAVLFLGLTIRIFRSKIWDEIPWLLITGGIFLSIFVLLVGIAYTDMTAFIAIRYTYIAAGYALMLTFEWLTILRSADLFCGYGKMRISELWKKRKSN